MRRGEGKYSQGHHYSSGRVRLWDQITHTLPHPSPPASLLTRKWSAGQRVTNCPRTSHLDMYLRQGTCLRYGSCLSFFHSELQLLIILSSFSASMIPDTLLGCLPDSTDCPPIRLKGSRWLSKMLHKRYRLLSWCKPKSGLQVKISSVYHHRNHYLWWGITKVKCP